MQEPQTQTAAEVRPFCEIIEKDGKLVQRLNMHEGQLRAWASEARVVIVVAGTQSGKTIFGPHWLAREISRRGEGDYLAVTATYDLFRLKMLPALLEVFRDMRGWKYSPSDRLIQSPDAKTRIILRSAEAEGGLESATAKAAWLDECGQPSFGREAFEAVMRRTRIYRGRMLLTTTPYTWNWFEQLVREAETDPEMEVIRFDSSTNPAFPREEIDFARRTMPEWRFRMFYLGEFTRPAAAIFSDYDERKHCVHPFVIPSDWPRNVGVDFGLVNTGIVWTALDPGKGIIYVYREKLGGGKSGDEWARECLKYREYIQGWWGGTAAETAQRMAWQAGGVPMAQPVIYDVEAGISHLVGLIRQDRLKVFTGLTQLRSQLLSYSREVDSEGNILEKVANKERYHLVDALRYACSAYPVELGIKEEQPEESERPLRAPVITPPDDGEMKEEGLDDYS